MKTARKVAVLGVGEADLAPPSLTLLLTKQALSSLLGVMMWVLFVCGSGVGRE